MTDGGVNRLMEVCVDHQTELIPDLITGDFDSALPDNLDYYRNKVGSSRIIDKNKIEIEVKLIKSFKFVLIRDVQFEPQMEQICFFVFFDEIKFDLNKSSICSILSQS